MTTVRRMHYVPRSLLRHFTDSDGKLWVYDKQERTWFLTSIVNAGVEKDIYPQDIESWFGKEIESPAGAIFKNLRNGKTNISGSDMSDVANFISAQMMRVPAIRDSISERDDPDFLHDIMQNIANELHTLEQLSKFSMSPSERKELKRLLYLSKSDPALFLSEQGRGDEFTLALEGRMRREDSQISGFLMRLAWRVIYTGKGRYILSDNPVAIWNLSHRGGANDEKFECVLPIGNNCALHIGRYGNGGVINEVLKDDRLVRKFNSRMIARAHRFIYTSRKENWISKSSHSRFPRLPHFQPTGLLIHARYDRPPCPHCGNEFTQEEWNSSETNNTVRTEEGNYVLVENRTIQHLCPERDN